MAIKSATMVVIVTNDRDDKFVFSPFGPDKLKLETVNWNNGRKPDDYATYLTEAGDAAQEVSGRSVS